MPDASSIASGIRKSYNRIHPYLRRTPLIWNEEQKVWLKCENEQHTGSFKFRGALSRLSLIPTGSRIVTASTGNHGLGVVRAAGIFGLLADIFLPVTASPAKVMKLNQPGVELHMVEGDSLQAELAGKAFALAHNVPWVSPYNDPDVINGQGTIALEIEEELPVFHKIYVTVGGGGLISGIAAWLSHHQPDVEIIGCQPVNSPEMYLSIQAGHVVQAPGAKPTLSDGSAGPLEEDSITFPICQQYISRFMLIEEDEIKRAVRYAYDRHGLIIEGAAGVALAAAMKDEMRTPEDISVVVICGGNIDPVVHDQICHEEV